MRFCCRGHPSFKRFQNYGLEREFLVKSKWKKSYLGKNTTSLPFIDHVQLYMAYIFNKINNCVAPVRNSDHQTTEGVNLHLINNVCVIKQNRMCNIYWHNIFYLCNSQWKDQMQFFIHAPPSRINKKNWNFFVGWQVSRCILDSCIRNEDGSLCRVVCTRRISAIAVSLQFSLKVWL